MTRIGLIWAEADAHAIGRGGVMPWHLPEDLAHFKRETLGSPVIMGRRTWESLPPRFRPLPGRMNVVVSRDPSFEAEGARVASSLPAAIELSGANEDRDGAVWVIGGGHLYRQAMEIATDIVVTRIDLAVPDADTFAPEIDETWQLARSSSPEISDTGLGYHFEWYRRGSGNLDR